MSLFDLLNLNRNDYLDLFKLLERGVDALERIADIAEDTSARDATRFKWQDERGGR